MPNLRERLSQGKILIADGATGTELQRAGLPVGAPSELWNLENPEGVRALHRSYLAAGSDIILTNTFGGSRIKLAKSGLGEQTTAINKRAAELAREVAGSQYFVLGDIGPTGALMDPMGDLTEELALQVFTEQTAALVAGGVDGILVETMSDLSEALAAVKAAKSVTDLPVLATMSFESHGRTMMGVKPAKAARELSAAGAEIVGVNCGRSLTENLTALQEMRTAYPDLALMAKPNAGLPHTDGSNTIFDVTPEIMADYAEKFNAVGIKILGACCGSTPAHIQAIAQTMHSQA